MDVGRKGRGPQAVINVTPLVDVVLVLLIIFMVITPLLEKHLEVSLPKQAEPDQLPPDNPEDQLVVSVAADGSIKLNEQGISRAELGQRLERELASRDQKLVFFQADDDAFYRDAVAVLDITRGAGAETIGTVLAPPSN
jgi:biopolymer transport protein ExbD